MNSSTKIIFLIITVIIVLGIAAAITNNNKTEKNMTQTELSVTTLAEGAGAAAQVGNEVVVNYRGTLLDGTQFDSSYDRGTSFSFTLGAGQVISGWDQGIVGMKVGEKRKLVVPGRLAYGPQGIVGTPIGPNATLVFEVELLEIK